MATGQLTDVGPPDETSKIPEFLEIEKTSDSDRRIETREELMNRVFVDLRCRLGASDLCNQEIVMSLVHRGAVQLIDQVGGV